MIRKLEDFYYYTAMLVLVLSIITHFIVSGMLPKTEKPDYMLPVAPSESIVYDDRTDLHYFDGSSFSEGNTLVFLTYHQFIKVYADDQLIYSALDENPRFGLTTGTRWNFVDIPGDAKEVQVSLTGAYPSTSHQDVSFYHGARGEAHHQLLRSSFFSMFLSILLVVIGVGLIVIWLLINSKTPINRALIFLGMLALCMGLWSFLESDISMLLLSKRDIVSYFALLILMFMQIPFASYIRERLEPDNNWSWCIVYVYSVANLVISLILQAFHIVDLRQTLVVTYVGFTLLFVYAAYSVYLSARAHGYTKTLRSNIMSLIVLALCLIFELEDYYNHQSMIGLIGKIGFTLFIILLGISVSSSALKQMEEGKKALYYKELANTDILTGLNSRNSYIADLESGIFGLGDAVVLFDLNDLKLTNDMLGHSVGDQYLIDSANLISSVFGSFGKCYRIGGDEFCVIIRNITESEIQNMISVLKEKQNAYNQVSPSLSLKIACGYAMYLPEQDADIEAARNRADKEMYLDKADMKQSTGLPTNS